ncbi:hypothetical protein NLJ89_g3744 [Agrocybe chaxingu]|uniref:DUF6534 domain-containing protein n=1 Tax=Agrocybe chaxingu TaxID=84603 RepID=A0A9W8K3E0_9AGAR|nr:hypothetical protein NLJ89_g3744 [Agrocybe chaxingu]
MKGLWHYLIDNYGNVLSLLFIDWTLAAILTSVLVQGFYSYRLWMISVKTMVVLPIIIMLLGFAALALGIVYVVLMLRNGAVLYIPTVTYLPTSALALSLAADILITTSMTYILMKHKGEVRIRQTRNTLTKLVMYTIYTGSLTILCTTCALITGQVLSHTEYNTIFFFPSGKFYVNSMLALSVYTRLPPRID